MDYNFNIDYEGETTVEEEIMKQLSNDLGQPVLPHVAHIIITEFRKFIFLIEEHNHFWKESKISNSYYFCILLQLVLWNSLSNYFYRVRKCNSRVLRRTPNPILPCSSCSRPNLVYLSLNARCLHKIL